MNNKYFKIIKILFFLLYTNITAIEKNNISIEESFIPVPSEIKKKIKNLFEETLFISKNMINFLPDIDNDIRDLLSDYFINIQNIYLNLDTSFEKKELYENDLLVLLKIVFFMDYSLKHNSKNLLKIKKYIDYKINNILNKKIYNLNMINYILNTIEKKLENIQFLEKEKKLNMWQKIYRYLYYKIEKNNYLSFLANNLIPSFSIFSVFDAFTYINYDYSYCMNCIVGLHNYFNNYHNDDKKKIKVDLIKNNPFLIKYITPIGIGFITYNSLYYFKDKGYFDPIIKCWRSIHNFLMGEKFKGIFNQGILDEIIQYDAEVNTSLKNNSFNIFREKGLLKWFDSTLTEIEMVYKKKQDQINKNSNKIILISGDSGSGKTHLIRTFHEDIKNIAKCYGDENYIEFYPIEPKHFNTVVLDRWKCPIDILTELEIKLESIRHQKKIIIIHFDEFHLYFYNEYGQLSQTRIADFLKFFSLVQDKQKENNQGAMFVILTTNKPEFVPYEMYTNPSRINLVIKLPSLTCEEIINIMQSFYQDYGINIENLNLHYFGLLMENNAISKGNLLRILNDSIYLLKNSNKTLNNFTIYELYNKKIRHISYLDTYNGENKLAEKILAKQFSLVIAISNSLKEYNDAVLFDCATIFPIEDDHGSWPSHYLYIKNDFNNSQQQGKIFYINKNKNIINQKDTLVKIINNIIQILYVKNEDNQYLNDYKYFYDDVYTSLYNYLLYKDGFDHGLSHIKRNIAIKNKDFGLSHKVNFESNFDPSNLTLHNTVISKIDKIQKIILKYLPDIVTEHKDMMLEIESTLLSKKIYSILDYTYEYSSNNIKIMIDEIEKELFFT